MWEETSSFQNFHVEKTRLTPSEEYMSGRCYQDLPSSNGRNAESEETRNKRRSV